MGMPIAGTPFRRLSRFRTVEPVEDPLVIVLAGIGICFTAVCTGRPDSRFDVPNRNEFINIRNCGRSCTPTAVTDMRFRQAVVNRRKITRHRTFEFTGLADS